MLAGNPVRAVRTVSAHAACHIMAAGLVTSATTQLKCVWLKQSGTGGMAGALHCIGQE